MLQIIGSTCILFWQHARFPGLYECMLVKDLCETTQRLIKRCDKNNKFAYRLCEMSAVTARYLAVLLHLLSISCASVSILGLLLYLPFSTYNSTLIISADNGTVQTEQEVCFFPGRICHRRLTLRCSYVNNKRQFLQLTNKVAFTLNVIMA